MTVVGNARSLTDIDPVKIAELFSIQEAITHVVSQLIATGRTWPLESSKHAPESTRSDFMATRLQLRTADEVNGLKLISTQGSVSIVSHSHDDKKSRRSSSGGTNPEATPFTPASQKTGSTSEKIQPTKGIRTPQEFLLNLQSKDMEKKIEAAGTGRRVILKNLPTDATLTDVFCLIFNGQIENVSLNGRDATVDFVDTASADAYFNKVCNGIRVGEHLITVERVTSPKITAHVVNCVKSRTTRVVHAIVPLNMTMKELYDAAAEFHVEHIEYHIEPNKNRRAYFFLCGLSDGYNMMRKLILAPEWNQGGCSPNFLADPCTANWFHTNTLSPSLLASATVVEVETEAKDDPFSEESQPNFENNVE